jgi:PST family polysaccharide transporter
MSLKEQAIKGTMWTTIQQWSNRFVSLITFSILARLLEPDSFGLIALAGTFLAFITLFVDQGFSTAIIQRKDLEPEHLDTAFWTNVAIGWVMATITFGIAGFGADFFKEPSLTPVVRWLSLSFIISSFNSVQSAILTKRLEFKLLAMRSLISTFISAVVGITMAFMGYGVWSLVAQQLSGSFVGGIVLWQASDWRPQWKFSRKHFHDLFAFGINLVGINILNFFVTRGDNLLIGYFLGSTALGYYDLAYRLLLVVTSLFVGVISSIAMPIFSSIQDDLPRLRKVLYEFVELTNTIAFPVFLGMSVLAPELIVVVFGEQWKPSIPVMQILSLAGLLYGGFYFNAPLMMAMGKPNWKFYLDIYRTIIYVSAFLVGVKFGIIGVSIAFVASAYLGSSWVTIIIIQKLIKINILTYLSSFFHPLVNSIIMIVLIILVRYIIMIYQSSINPFLLCLYIVIGVLTYCVSLYNISNKLFSKFDKIRQQFLLKILS